MTSTLGSIDWSTLGIWVGAFMESLVAFVILYEVEQHRRSSFLDEASESELFSDREEIYLLFLETDGQTAEEKSEAFCHALWSNQPLRSKCDRQLVLFSKLGHLLTPRPICWLIRNDVVLHWFPQSAAILWLILMPYVRERRKRAGKFWAKPFSDFTRASVKFLLRQDVETLEMFHPKRCDVPGLRIGKEQLERIEKQTKGES